MRSHSHVNTASSIIDRYNGAIPLAAWLKDFFKSNKKFGSSDRRMIAHLCYCFYRLGNALIHMTVEERLLLGVFLCSSGPNKVLQELKPEWNEKVGLPVSDKIEIAGMREATTHIFPFSPRLSPSIDAAAFGRSHLIQPDLFLRIRPGRNQMVMQQLASLHDVIRNEDCVRLPNQTKTEDLLEIDRDVVIQDMNSQKVMRQLPAGNRLSVRWKMWDCCAASGGKSLLFHDLFPASFITASDIRDSIIINLRNRFQRAGLHHYKAFVADVSDDGFRMEQTFDIIVCDAPCSGSGTWSRTPEQLKFFREEKIHQYSDLQKKIAVNTSRQLNPDGYFLYITCSVFLEENEQVVEYLQAQTGLQLVDMEYMHGYDQKADTLFTALFRRS